ncbi:MAG: LytTR family DNA-binding domain-containing protein [Cyclobacteriaceae bacterium]
MKLRAIIVDDEQHCIDTLSFDLKRRCKEQVEVVATAKNAMEALSFISKDKPDILFLDIDLPGMSGLQFLEALGDLSVKVIFTTAHSKYAVPAYKFKAEAFLVKPIDTEDLEEVVGRLYEELSQQKQRLFSDKLPVSSTKGTEFIALDQIVACESSSNYCLIHLASGEDRMVSKTLKAIEASLTGDEFVRIHQSYLINLRYLKSYLKTDGGSVELTNGKVYPVSKSYRPGLQRLLPG